jgi:voltage-gated potassium channel
MEFAFSYIHLFMLHLVAAWPLLALLAALIVVLGLLAGAVESWPRFDAIYWAFVTATTVGYGDIRPKKRLSRVLSILIAFIGVTFTGLFVALAISAATMAFKGMEALGHSVPSG